MSRMSRRDGNKKRREDRQIQAKVRQAEYDKLSPTEKMAKLGNLAAVKERIKLHTLISGNTPSVKSKKAVA